MRLSWNRFLLLAFVAGIFICACFAWLLAHEEVRIMLVGPNITPQVGLMIMTASLGILALVYPPLWWIIFEVTPFISLVREHGWKMARVIYKRQHCKHEWELDPTNSMKRHCIKCEKEQWVVGRPYPRIGEPAYWWEDHNWDEVRLTHL